MPSFHSSRHVQHTATQMFDLVSDVEAYPQFLPLCRSLHILQSSKEGECQTFVAEMQVGYKAIRESFKTRVVCDRPKHRILVNYIDGPFRYLENHWSFRETENRRGGSDVDFQIDYEFKNRMLGLLMGSMFDQAFRRFADAFERRANQVYGRPSLSARSLA